MTQLFNAEFIERRLAEHRAWQENEAELATREAMAEVVMAIGEVLQRRAAETGFLGPDRPGMPFQSRATQRPCGRAMRNSVRKGGRGEIARAIAPALLKSGPD